MGIGIPGGGPPGGRTPGGIAPGGIGPKPAINVPSRTYERAFAIKLEHPFERSWPENQTYEGKENSCSDD